MLLFPHQRITPYNNIKYQIEISQKYWESIFRSEGITDRRKQQERIVQEKQTTRGTC